MRDWVICTRSLEETSGRTGIPAQVCLTWKPVGPETLLWSFLVCLEKVLGLPFWSKPRSPSGYNFLLQVNPWVCVLLTITHPVPTESWSYQLWCLFSVSLCGALHVTCCGPILDSKIHCISPEDILFICLWCFFLLFVHRDPFKMCNISY